jgi:hypothetical protein
VGVAAASSQSIARAGRVLIIAAHSGVASGLQEEWDPAASGPGSWQLAVAAAASSLALHRPPISPARSMCSAQCAVLRFLKHKTCHTNIPPPGIGDGGCRLCTFYSMYTPDLNLNLKRASVPPRAPGGRRARAWARGKGKGNRARARPRACFLSAAAAAS